jgi:hypothetical protein
MSLSTRSYSLPLGRLLLVILAAGLLAGLVTAVFHTVATEPIIDQAIQFEEMRHADEQPSAEVVSREVQKVGLFVGWLMLGFVYAALLGAAYAIARTQGWVGPGWAGPIVLAAGAYLAIALVPALKYPANPPGVGESASIGFRQATFVAFWALAVVGALLAAALSSRLSLPPIGRAGVAVVIFAGWSLALYLLLPPNPDPVTLPLDLVTAFRLRSVAGLTLFWAVLAAIFAAASVPLNRGAVA